MIPSSHPMPAPPLPILPRVLHFDTTTREIVGPGTGMTGATLAAFTESPPLAAIHLPSSRSVTYQRSRYLIASFDAHHADGPHLVLTGVRPVMLFAARPGADLAPRRIRRQQARQAKPPLPLAF